MKKIIAVFSGIMVLGSAFFAPAIAGARECKTVTVTRTGGEGALLFTAKKHARDAWRQKVEENYGKEWSAWYVSKGLSYDCRDIKGGKKVCVAKAKPCKLPIVIKGPGKTCAFYRIEGTGKPSRLQAWAKHNSRKVWVEHVQQHYGKRFDTWLIANDRKNECKKNKKDEYVCIAGAKPCKFQLVR